MKPSEQQKIKLDFFQIESVDFKSGNLLDKTTTKGASLNLDYSVYKAENDNERFGIHFDVKLLNEDTGFKLYILAVGHFLMANVKDIDKFIDSDFAKMNAPAIAFPYLRTFVSNILLNSGLNPIILPTLNFASLSKQNQMSED